MALLDVLRRMNFVGDGRGRTADKTTGEKEAIWDRGTILYVEFAAATGMRDRLEEMRELARSLSMDFIGVRAEEVFAGEKGSSGNVPNAFGISLHDAGELHMV